MSASDAAFESALAATLAYEGGFSKDPNDPGNWTGGRPGAGELRGTMQGISAKSYPTLQIHFLTPADVAAIYFRDYWLKLQCDKLHEIPATVLFDYGVNCGAGAASFALQRAVGAGQDGVIGPKTLMLSYDLSAADLATRLQEERWVYMTGLANWPRYKRGWTRRLVKIDLFIGRYAPSINSAASPLARRTRIAP